LVSAASSLSEAFAELESAFEDINPEIDVLLNLGGSSLLREQIIAGAPVDVYASASTSDMGQVVEAGLAHDPKTFALNMMEIAAPSGNPAGVTGLDAFGDDDLLIGLCDSGIPCGVYGRQVLSRAGIELLVDTNEPNVRSLLTKVEAGELDAGIVYVTDVISAQGLVFGITIPEDLNVIAEYPIAVMAEAPNREGAGLFVEFILSSEGASILAEHGFALP
jgi:molybdate transport system substrate-binding protein